MSDWLAALAGASFMPHGHCYLWTPSLVWLYVISDSIIAAAYYSIPVALTYFVRKRRDLQFNWIFKLFSLFIFACGTTHVIAIWTIWQPVYWLDAWVKVVTAAASIITAILLWPLIPRALKVASPEQLQVIINQLEHEVHERKEAEQALAQLNETLEQRVAARTAELEASNRQLAMEIESRQRAEERFRRVVEFAPSAMLMTSRDGVIEIANAQAERIFQYARTELLGRPIEVLVPERFRDAHPDVRTSYYAAPGFRSLGEGRDLYGVRKDGSEVPVEIALNPIDTDEGPKVLAAVVDISDRRQKEEGIKAALREKVTLLEEVHHRVKNNLQIIHSLLDLQALQIQDPAVRAMLEDNKNRIRSMAMIHQTLYQSKDFASVDLGEVIKNLVGYLTTSYGVDARRLNVSIDVASAPLPLNRAIPCGLIANELISNAFKHAFPDGRHGTVAVWLTLDPDGEVLLSVSDDGVGLRGGFESGAPGTLGLELVNILTEQLHGRLAMHTAAPTRFEVRFPQSGSTRE